MWLPIPTPIPEAGSCRRPEIRLIEGLAISMGEYSSYELHVLATIAAAKSTVIKLLCLNISILGLEGPDEEHVRELPFPFLDTSTTFRHRAARASIQKAPVEIRGKLGIPSRRSEGRHESHLEFLGVVLPLLLWDGWDDF